MTLPQVEAAGLEPVVFMDEGQPLPARNRANFERAVARAFDDGTDLLLFEDDVDLSLDFAAALEAARAFGEPVVFWLSKEHNHPASWVGAIKFGLDAPPAGLYPVRRLNLWFGTQAILLPFAWVERVRADAAFGVPDGLPFDRWLRDRLTRLLVALPNPVQHRSPTTLVDPTRVARISPTFHLPRHADDWGC